MRAGLVENLLIHRAHRNDIVRLQHRVPRVQRIGLGRIVNHHSDPRELPEGNPVGNTEELSVEPGGLCNRRSGGQDRLQLQGPNLAAIRVRHGAREGVVRGHPGVPEVHCHRHHLSSALVPNAI